MRTLLCSLVCAASAAGATGEYAGRAVCSACHPKQARAQGATAMGRALQDWEILKSRPRLTLKRGDYSYEIRREGDRSLYSVTDGRDALTAPIDYVFGLGHAGQTYVFRRAGNFYESRVSFYQETGGLDLTIGAPPTPPKNLDEAAGRRMSPDDARECFGCHSTAAVERRELRLERMVAGIHCENCHGPAAAHAEARAAGQAYPMKRLSALNAEEMATLCGSCHRTWETVVSQGLTGVGSIRFQPYRLANSKCYDGADRRIACTTCHDSHRDAMREASYYDAKCQACHAGGARTCKTAASGCVTCHMPKFELPGGHHAFTDHQIRVHRAGDPFPN